MAIRATAKRITVTLSHDLAARLQAGAKARGETPSRYLERVLARVQWEKPLDQRELAMTGAMIPDDREWVALLLLSRWSRLRPRVADSRRAAREAAEEHNSAMRVALSRMSVTHHPAWVKWRREGQDAPYQGKMLGSTMKRHLSREDQIVYRTEAMRLLHEDWGFYWGAWAALHCPLVTVNDATRDDPLDQAWKRLGGVERRGPTSAAGARAGPDSSPAAPRPKPVHRTAP